MSNVTHVPIFRINISPSAGIKNSIDNNTTSRNISSEHGNFTLDGRINSTTYDWHLWNASDLKVEVVGDALVKLATWHGHVTLSAARNPTYFKRLYRLGPYTRYSFLTNRLIFTDKSRYFASKNPLYFPYFYLLPSCRKPLYPNFCIQPLVRKHRSEHIGKEKTKNGRWTTNSTPKQTNQLQTLLEQRYPLIYLANPTARIRIQSWTEHVFRPLVRGSNESSC